MSKLEEGESVSMSLQQAQEVWTSLVSDNSMLQRELSSAGKTEMTPTEKAQYVLFAASVLSALEELAGSGLSLFTEKPIFRVGEVDVDNANSLKKMRLKLEAAAKVLRAA